MQEQSWLAAFDRLPWRAWKNVAASPAPAWAILRVTDYSIVNGEIQFKCAQPNSTAQAVYLVNGPTDVPVNEEGICTTLMHGGNLLVNLASGAPSAGQVWGAKANQWSAEKDASGFFVCGAAQGVGSRARVAAIQASSGSAIKLGKPDNNIDSGNPGAVSIWSGPAGGETDTGDDVTAFARDAGVLKGQWVVLMSINGAWYVGPYLENAQIGKPFSASGIEKGQLGLMKIYRGPSGSEADSGVTVTARALFAKVPADKWCSLACINGNWYVSPVECP